MVRRRRLDLTEDTREALLACRDHDPHPQLRERAAALLKIADGMSPHAVARTGLLRPRDPDTVYCWLDQYQAGGIPALRAHLHGGSVGGRLRRRPHPGAGPAPTRRGGSPRAGSAGGRAPT